MYSTKAYLQKPDKQGVGRIYIRYTHDRKTNAISLDKKVEAFKFDSKNGLIYNKYPEAESLNSAIREAQQLIEKVAASLRTPEFALVKKGFLERSAELKAKKKQERYNRVIPDLYNHFEAEEIPQQIKEYQEKINELLVKQRELSAKGYKNESVEELEFRNYLAEYPDTFNSKSKSAKAHINVWIKVLLEFSEKTNTTLTYDIFDYKFYDSYAKYLMYDSEHKYFNNNFGNHVKRLKAFLQWLEDDKGVTVINKGYKKYKVLKEEIEIIYLTSEELELLWNHRSEVEAPFVKYIDLCVFGNLTGLRYSDIKRSYWKIENGFLQGKTKKTKGNYQIPLKLDSRIEEILKKYNYSLNLVSSVKFNKYIKTICGELFKKNEINQIPIPICRYKLKDEFITYHLKHELIASHSSRRGFCTRLWQDSWSERDILLMLGSKSNDVLRKYVRNSTEDLLRKVNEKLKQTIVSNVEE
ncbi:hypothetical protein ACFS7Z_08760 [Pontibacter toksunensis]|uniref:Arm DNA-binding domain-containing protein n=1 Tax=Pontibacter toksunensis TaxID=1332631 RepID=A0ABW6BU01_9BACT